MSPFTQCPLGTREAHILANSLTGRFVHVVRTPGRYGDRDGLLLRVRPRGGKQWIWRGTVKGQGRVELGLGSYPKVSLAEARKKAVKNHRFARVGIDPRVLQGRVPTFTEAFEVVLASRRPSWKSDGTEAQWRSSMRDHVLPKLGSKKIDEVTEADVLDALLPTWSSKPVMGRQLHERIGAVMKWAVSHGDREDNPADAITDRLPAQAASARPTSSHVMKRVRELARQILDRQRRGDTHCTEYVLDVLELMVTVGPTDDQERLREDATGLLFEPEGCEPLIERSKTDHTVRKLAKILVRLMKKARKNEWPYRMAVHAEGFDEGYTRLRDWAIGATRDEPRPDGRRRSRGHINYERDKAITVAMTRLKRFTRRTMTSREGRTGTSIAHLVADRLGISYSVVAGAWCRHCGQELLERKEEVRHAWHLMETVGRRMAYWVRHLDKTETEFDLAALRWYSTHQAVPPRHRGDSQHV